MDFKTEASSNPNESRQEQNLINTIDSNHFFEQLKGDVSDLVNARKNTCRSGMPNSQAEKKLIGNCSTAQVCIGDG